MTQHHLLRAVACATGESPRTLRRLGFSLHPAPHAEPDPADLSLVLDCPFCRRAVPYPGAVDDGDASLAECPRCDVEFEFSPTEVYATTPPPARVAG